MDIWESYPAIANFSPPEDNQAKRSQWGSTGDGPLLKGLLGTAHPHRYIRWKNILFIAFFKVEIIEFGASLLLSLFVSCCCLSQWLEIFQIFVWNAQQSVPKQSAFWMDTDPDDYVETIVTTQNVYRPSFFAPNERIPITRMHQLQNKDPFHYSNRNRLPKRCFRPFFGYRSSSPSSHQINRKKYFFTQNTINEHCLLRRFFLFFFSIEKMIY